MRYSAMWQDTQVKVHAAWGTTLGTALVAAGLLAGGTGGRAVGGRAAFARTPASRAPGDSVPTAFPTRLDGTYWSHLTSAEKRIYLAGFVAGAAAEQAGAAGMPADSLRGRHALDFAFAPSVYAAEIDDFYWWEDHTSTPIVEAMRQINGSR
jgi:hypothetical protein